MQHHSLEQAQHNLRRRDKRKRAVEQEWLRAGGLGGCGLGAGGIGIGPSAGAGGSPPPSGGALDPLTIVTSRTNIFAFSADVGYTPGDWQDQGVNNYDAVQATGAAQPTLNVGVFNTRNTLSFDGVDDRLVVNTWNPPAPATTSTFFWGVLRPLSDGSNDSMFGAANTQLRLWRGGILSWLINNGLSTSQVLTVLGQWYRVKAYFSASTSDYLQMGTSTNTPLTSAGNNNPAAGTWTMGAQQVAGTSAAQCDYACMFAWQGGEPTGAEFIALDAWCHNYYGSTVQV